MEQTFGAFIRQKRLERMIKLNVFATQIGISNVYLSYIETGKRPAPSPEIIKRIVFSLELNPEETNMLYALAELSRRQPRMPEIIWEYITTRPYVIDTMYLAIQNNADERQWERIRMILDLTNNT